MLFFDPVLRGVFGGDLPPASEIMADDDGIEQLIARLEELDEEVDLGRLTRTSAAKSRGRHPRRAGPRRRSGRHPASPPLPLTRSAGAIAQRDLPASMAE